MFDVSHGSISLQFIKNLKFNRIINLENKHKLNSVTKVYALFINMDHKHGLYSIFHASAIKNTQTLDFSSQSQSEIFILHALFDQTVLWYPKYYLVSSVFLVSELHNIKNPFSLLRQHAANFQIYTNCVNELYGRIQDKLC